MLSFAVYSNGKPAESVDLTGAYVVGTDDVPLRADIALKNGMIQCKKRAGGPAGLALLWDVPDVGRVMLETVRVPEREKPYILQVELARARLMRIQHKLEDWGLLDYEGIDDIAQQVGASREKLIQALQADRPADAAALAEEALATACTASEDLTMQRAAQALYRRRQAGGFGQRVLGCGIPLDKPADAILKHITPAFDFVNVPLVWRDIEPNEQTFNWKPLDAWVDTLAKKRIPMKGSALLSFSEQAVPDWLYIWEHDFDTIRDLAFEHVRRVINRYGQYIQAWDVISGIHATNCFTFNFEQLMELTRMAAALTKQLARRSTAIIELVAPWGEYYARNQRTIPPLLYADMAVQSGVNFDAFGLQFLFGPDIDGMYLRDMFQISSQLDQFAKLGKPIHVTTVQVPSQPHPGEAAGSRWRTGWSQQTQADWLTTFLDMALSKTFVESVCWRTLLDHAAPVPAGGLLRDDLTPKAAHQTMVQRHADLRGGTTRSPRGRAT